MKKFLTYFIFVVLLGGIIFLYSFSSERNGEKKVEKVVVEFEEGINYFLTYKMVNKLLIENNQKTKNQRKSVIDLQGLEYNVLSNPYVEKATVFLTIDGLLKTRVKQRTPIARIKGSVRSYYIDKQGVIMPLSANYSARVILVTGVIRKENLKDVILLVNKILSDDFLKKEIVGIHKTKKNEFILSVRSGNQKIEIGDLDKMNIKFRKLKAFYNKAYVDKTIEQYRIINLKYLNQVVCTK